jgi:two-component system chemotaxis response regulator CheB
MAKVNVLVVDDSPLCQQLIVGALSKDPDLAVVGLASDGEEAVEMAARLRPDVITMDVEMPKLDGISATERIMNASPTPILMLTGDPRNQALDLTNRALAAGALALQIKPALDANDEGWNLSREVKILAGVKVVRPSERVNVTPLPFDLAAVPLDAGPAAGIIAIAGGIGSPPIVQRLVSQLPVDFAASVLIVQQMNPAFVDSFAGWLSSDSKLRVKVAAEGDLLKPGSVYIAPAFGHLVVAARGRVGIRLEGPIDGQLPSATAMLESMAKIYGARSVGILLSGMGEDGVNGIAAVRAVGGRTIAQSEDSCAVFGTPGAAIARGVVDLIVHANKLAPILIRLTQPKRQTAAGA